MKVTIREPYYSAWKRYNWNKGCWGIGIKKEYFTKAVRLGEKLEIHIDSLNSDYTTDPGRMMAYAVAKGAKFIAGKGTILYMIPNYFLDKVVTKKEEPKKDIQEPLF